MAPERNRRRVLAGLAAALLWPHHRPVRATAPRALEFGVLPNINTRALIAAYEPMRAYLERHLGLPVRLSTARDWPTFQQRVLEQSFDLIAAAPNIARLAELDAGWQALAVLQPDTEGLLVHAAQRPLRDLQDLRGQRLALANPASLVALHGMAWLAQQGLQSGRDFTQVAVPTDDSVAGPLLGGDCVAAVLSGGELRAVPEAQRVQLVRAARFAEVPSFVLCAARHVPARTARHWRELLLSFAGDTEFGSHFFRPAGPRTLVPADAAWARALDGYLPNTRAALAALAR
jgi:phosphonate transport system substrate-binding protein